MSLKRQVAIRSAIFAELLGFFWQNKLWWLIPILLLISLMMLFVFFGQTSGLAPFIYPLF